LQVSRADLAWKIEEDTPDMNITHLCARVLFLALVVVPVSSASAQWLNVRAEGVPRLSDGRPDLAAAPPVSDDGVPVLSGTWQVEPDGQEGLSAPPRHLLNLAADLEPGAVRMHPWAAGLYDLRASEQSLNFPMSFCLPPGLPLSYTIPAPFKILELPGLVVILYEISNTFRQIFTDGRPFPEDPVPTWQGYSTGSWDGSTFVVESIGFNERTWLDGFGHAHTDRLHLTERYRRVDFGHLEIEVTVSDPGAYLEPWTATIEAELVPDVELIEYVCQENERDREHLDALR
jgi:hypothetical protein